MPILGLPTVSGILGQFHRTSSTIAVVRTLSGDLRRIDLGPNGGVPTGYKFDASELKQSVGLAAQWLAPMGLFRFSYAFPLNDSKASPLRFADQVEQFQFSIGGAF